MTDARLHRILSLQYFVFFAALAVYLPYMPAWLKARGASGFEIGVLTALSPAMSVAAPPLIGLLADTFGLRGALMRAAATGATLSIAALALAVFVDPHLGFWAAFFCIFGFTLFRTPVSQLTDVIALERAGDYGRMRVWGSIGFMLAALAAGRWVPLDPAWVLPLITAAGMALAAWVSWFLPRRAALPERPLWIEARRLLSHTSFRWLLFSAALGQAAHAAYDLCLTLHLLELGASGTEVGLAWAIATLGEVGLLVISARLLRRLSVVTWLSIALGVGALRWSLLALVSDLEWILLSQPLHGLTFGMRWVCCLALVRRLASASAMATAQGLFLAAFSAGSVIGMLTWGATFETHGAREVFSWAALLATLAVFVTLPLRWTTRALEPAAVRAP